MVQIHTEDISILKKEVELKEEQYENDINSYRCRLWLKLPYSLIKRSPTSPHYIMLLKKFNEKLRRIKICGILMLPYTEH